MLWCFQIISANMGFKLKIRNKTIWIFLRNRRLFLLFFKQETYFHELLEMSCPMVLGKFFRVKVFFSQHPTKVCCRVGMYKVDGLRLGPNFGVCLTADKNFYLRSTIEKIHALTVFTEKYLRSHGCSAPILRLRLTVQIQKLK